MAEMVASNPQLVLPGDAPGAAAIAGAQRQTVQDLRALDRAAQGASQRLTTHDGQIGALQSQVAALQATVADLQAQLTALSDRMTTLEVWQTETATTILALQAADTGFDNRLDVIEPKVTTIEAGYVSYRYDADAGTYYLRHEDGALDVNKWNANYFFWKASGVWQWVRNDS